MSLAATDQTVRTGRVTRAFIYVFLLVFALFYLLPFFIMMANSLKPLSEITEGNMIALPKVWTLEPWVKAWSTAQVGVEPTGLKPYFWNSIKMVVPAVAISTILGALNGYILTKWRFRGDTLLFLKRRPGGALSDCWELPGGKVKHGEEPKAGLRRELLEELGVESSIGALQGRTSFVHRDEHFDLLGFEATLLHQGITLAEHEDSAYLTPREAARRLLAPSDRSLLEAIGDL